MSEQYTISELKDRLNPIFEKHGVRKAVLFGSYGKGTASAKSDVDLFVDSGLRGLRFVGLLEDIQQALGIDVDLFDVTHIEAGSQIDREIQETGVLIYRNTTENL